MSDDDASARNLLTNGPNNPHLLDTFPTPTFLANLNHRIKCIAKPIFGLAAMNKGISRVIRGDALRIKRNYAWYFKSQVKKKSGNYNNFVNGAEAPLHHHISVHHWWDGEWCWAKRLDDEKEAKMCQVEQLGKEQSANDNQNKFRMISDDFRDSVVRR